MPLATGDLLLILRLSKSCGKRVCRCWERLAYAENLAGLGALVSFLEVYVFFLHCVLRKQTCHSKTQGRELVSPEKVRYGYGGITVGVLKIALISAR